MHRFDDPRQVIRIGVDETFAIALAGNPTTGYTWKADVDGQYLEPLGQEFEARGPGVGAGGQEVLRFRARKQGEIEITCVYRRPWGGESIDTRSFRVVIG